MINNKEEDNILANIRYNIALNNSLSHRLVIAIYLDLYNTIVLLEFLFLIMFLFYLIDTGTLSPSSMSFLSSLVKVTNNELSINLIPLIVEIITSDYADKIVLNLDYNIYVKGRDKLPLLIIESDNRMDEVLKNFATELVNNFYSRKDEIFDIIEVPRLVSCFKNSL